MKIYIYLTPQANDVCPITGKKICKTVIETIEVAREKDSDIVPTYAGGIEVYPGFLGGETFVILSNGETEDMNTDVSVDIELELLDKFKTIKLQDIPDTEPIAKRLSINAFNYVHGKFMDEHGEEMQEDATLAIKKLREERAQTIRTELDLVATIAKSNGLGFIESSTIEELDGTQNAEETAQLLSKVVREGEVNANEISIHELKSYKILFDNKTALERTLEDGKESYSVIEQS